MSPEKQKPTRSKARKPAARFGPDPNAPWEIVYFQRHAEDDPAKAVPGQAFLARCPNATANTMLAVVVAVAEAPPQRFSGGGMWEAMSDDLTGYHEVRVNGPGRRHYRLFCKLDRAAVDKDGQPVGPYLVILDGDDKPNAELFPAAVYRRVKNLGDEYLKRNPRSII